MRAADVAMLAFAAAVFLIFASYTACSAKACADRGGVLVQSIGWGCAKAAP